MFCANCGSPIPDMAKFCMGCGARVDREPRLSPAPANLAAEPQAAPFASGTPRWENQVPIAAARPVLAAEPSPKWHDHMQWSMVGGAGILISALGARFPPRPALDPLLSVVWDSNRAQLLAYGIGLVVILWLAKQRQRLPLIVGLLCGYLFVRTLIFSAPPALAIVLNPGRSWLPEILASWGVLLAFIAAAVGAIQLVLALLEGRDSDRR